MPQVPDSRDRYWDAVRAVAADLRSAQGSLHEAERLGEKYVFDDLRRIRECRRASGDAADSLASMLRDHDRPATCFPAGTAIATPSGTRRIETLKPGDRVTSRSERTGEFTLRRVRRMTSPPPTRLWQVALDDGRQILTTANHRFRCGDHWVRADRLHADDRLHCASGGSSAGTAACALHAEANVLAFDAGVPAVDLERAVKGKGVRELQGTAAMFAWGGLGRVKLTSTSTRRFGDGLAMRKRMGSFGRGHFVYTTAETGFHHLLLGQTSDAAELEQRYELAFWDGAEPE